jgi:hypothetical protein
MALKSSGADPSPSPFNIEGRQSHGWLGSRWRLVKVEDCFARFSLPMIATLFLNWHNLPAECQLA